MSGGSPSGHNEALISTTAQTLGGEGAMTNRWVTLGRDRFGVSIPATGLWVATVAFVQGATSQQARRRSTAHRRASRPIRTKTFTVCAVCLKPACRCPLGGQSEATTTNTRVTTTG